MGAGILPYAKHNGVLYFLFGKEIKNGLWSDFGGSRNGKEEPITTAIREGYEELSGFFGSQIDLRNLINKKNISINNEQYFTYLVEIPYDENLIQYYNNNFKFIQDKLPHIVDNKHNGLFEKIEIKWMTMEEIRSNMNIFRIHYKPILYKLMSTKII